MGGARAASASRVSGRQSARPKTQAECANSPTHGGRHQRKRGGPDRGAAKQSGDLVFVARWHLERCAPPCRECELGDIGHGSRGRDSCAEGASQRRSVPAARARDNHCCHEGHERRGADCARDVKARWNGRLHRPFNERRSPANAGDDLSRARGATEAGECRRQSGRPPAQNGRLGKARPAFGGCNVELDRAGSALCAMLRSRGSQQASARSARWAKVGPRMVQDGRNSLEANACEALVLIQNGAEDLAMEGLGPVPAMGGCDLLQVIETLGVNARDEFSLGVIEEWDQRLAAKAVVPLHGTSV